MEKLRFLLWSIRVSLASILLGRDDWDRDDVRHIIINKALCIQGKCLSCNGNKKTSGYYETQELCKLITDAARQIK